MFEFLGIDSQRGKRGKVARRLNITDLEKHRQFSLVNANATRALTTLRVIKINLSVRTNTITPRVHNYVGRCLTEVPAECPGKTRHDDLISATGIETGVNPG